MFLLKSFSPTSFAPISWAPADESWVPEDELRPEYRGNGGRTTGLPKARARRQFDDATEQDIRDLVEARWELEALRQQRAGTPAAKQAREVSQPRPQPVGDLAPKSDVSANAPTTDSLLAPVIDADATRLRTLKRAQQQRAAIALILLLDEVD